MIRTVKDYERLSEQYNKMLEERNSLIDDLPWYKAKVSRLEDENEQLKESHIKHITNMENYYKDRVQELKEKNGELQEVIEGKNRDLLFTEDENAQLKQDLLRTEELQDEIIQLEKDFENKHNLLSEISQHIGNKPSSSTYKYFRGKLDGVGIKEGE